MRLTERYRRLTLWNKIQFWGALASVAGIIIAFAPYLIDKLSSSRPNVEVSATFLYPITPASHPEIIKEIRDDSDVFRTMVAYEPSLTNSLPSGLAVEDWFYAYRLFRVAFNNRSRNPVSLSLTRPESLRVDPIATDITVTPVAPFRTSDGPNGGFRSTPIVALAPFEMKRLYVDRKSVV